MRIFVDTNVFIEYIEKRIYFREVRLLFDVLEEKIHTGYISGGSFYTIAYIIDRGLRRKGVCNPERSLQVRSALLQILDLVDVVNIGNDDLLIGVSDTSFTDLEDSFQYHTALKARCDVLVTLNIKDFKPVGGSVRIISPEDFVREFL